MPKLVIDGITVEVAEGATILDAARAAGIDVPTLCHEEGLSPIGACRMCVVEVEGARRPVPSCATPAEEGMVVRTDTPALRNLRLQTLELLFAERNHICPACTKSGHCDLQRLGYRLGMNHVRYTYLHPVLPVDLSHPHIALDHNRCILCMRCVRVCAERVGVHTLDVQGRGGRSMIVADDGKPLGRSSCIGCGACVQVCPTGALFEKRTSHWQHEAEPLRVRTVCPACDVGCVIEVVLLHDAILGIDGGDGPANRRLVCGHGRFGLVRAVPPRVRQPMLRQADRLIPVDIDAAYRAVAARLSAGRVAQDRTRVAGIIADHLPLEVLAVFKEFMAEVVGTPNLGTPLSRHSRALRLALGGEAVHGLACVADLDEADLFFSIGWDPDEVQGVVGMAVRRGVYRRRAQLVEVNPGRTALADRAVLRLEPRYGSDAVLLSGLLKAMAEFPVVRDRLGVQAREALDALEPRTVQGRTGCLWEDVRRAAALLVSARRPVVLVGPGLSRQGEGAVRAAVNLALVRGVNEATGRLGLMPLVGGAAGRAATLMAIDTFDPTNFDPHEVDALMLLMADAVSPLPKAAVERIQAVPFVVLWTSWESPLMQVANVVLPAPAWPERQGTFVNLEGRVQRASCIRPKPADVPSETDLLARLASALGKEGTMDGLSAVPEWATLAPEGDLLTLGRHASELDIVVSLPEGA